MRGSKYFGIDLKYFLSGSYWTSIPNALEAISKLLVAVIFTRAVTPEIYGEYRFYMSILLTLVIFALPGMGDSIVQSVARKYYRSFIDGTRAMIKFSILGSLVFLAITIYFYVTGRTNLSIYFLLTSAFFPTLFSFRNYSSFLLGLEEYKKQAKYYSAQIIVMNLFFILAIALTRNLTIIILTYLVAGTVTNFIIYSMVKKEYAKEIKQSKKDPELIKYGKHLSVMSALPIISGNIDKILITFFLGFRTLAIYSIAQTIAQQNKVLFKPILKVILPRLSREKDTAKLYRALRLKLKYMIGISTVITLIGIFAAPIIVKIFFPPEYEKAAFYAQLLFIGYVVALANIIFINYLTAQKLTTSLYKITFYPAALRVISLVVLLPIFGIFGAIASELVTSYSIFGLLMYYSKKDSTKAQNYNTQDN